MAEDMTLPVLRYRLADIGADAKKGCRGLLNRIALDGQPADDHEALASQQDVVADHDQSFAELRKFKVVAINADVIDAALCDRPDGGIDLADLGIAQSVRKIAVASKVWTLPGRQLFQRLYRHCWRK